MKLLSSNGFPSFRIRSVNGHCCFFILLLVVLVGETTFLPRDDVCMDVFNDFYQYLTFKLVVLVLFSLLLICFIFLLNSRILERSFSGPFHSSSCSYLSLPF